MHGKLSQLFSQQELGQQKGKCSSCEQSGNKRGGKKDSYIPHLTVFMGIRQELTSSLLQIRADWCCSGWCAQAHNPNLPAHIIPTLHEGRYPGLAGRDDFLGTPHAHPAALDFEGAPTTLPSAF